MDDVNPFNVLSNEVILHIISSLDARSLFRFCGCSKRLQEFNNLSNDDWRKLYSEEWLVDQQELFLYADREWQGEFKSRFLAEKNYQVSNTPSNTLTQMLNLLLSKNAKQTLAALDSLWSEYSISPGFGSKQKLSCETGIIVTAIAKLIRDGDIPKNNARNYVKLLKLSLDASIDEVPLGMISLATQFLDLSYDTETLLETLDIVHEINKKSKSEEYDGWNERLLDIIEKHSSKELLHRAMAALSDISVDVRSRAALIPKILQLMDQTLAEAEFHYFDAVVLLIILLIDKNIDFLVAQGVLQKTIDILPKLDCAAYYQAMRVISEFCYQEPIAQKHAKDEVMLSYILGHAQRLYNNSTTTHDKLVVFDGIFCFLYALIYCRGNIQYMYSSPYLDFVLPYLAEDLGEAAYGNLCSVLSQYIRYGIETGRLNEVHKRFEPYIQTVMDSPYFKYSITIWQTYYCGMKLPNDIAKRLIERIMPELPSETDKKVMRAYSELLSNMVQVDNSPFMDIDAQQLYDYYSRQLILDDRTNDTSSRAKIPFAINFIAAGASIPQFAALAIRDQALLQKMYALYDRDKEQSETIYMVVNFFSYVVKLPDWNRQKGLDILERWGTTMPLDVPMYYMFTMIDSFVHMFLRDNPVELLLFGAWIIARMSQRQDGRDGLKKLSPEIIEWLSNHADPRLRKHMSYYHQNLHRAQMGFVDENYVQRI